MRIKEATGVPSMKHYAYCSTLLVQVWGAEISYFWLQHCLRQQQLQHAPCTMREKTGAAVITASMESTSRRRATVTCLRSEPAKAISPYGLGVSVSAGRGSVSPFRQRIYSFTHTLISVGEFSTWFSRISTPIVRLRRAAWPLHGCQCKFMCICNFAAH